MHRSLRYFALFERTTSYYYYYYYIIIIIIILLLLLLLLLGDQSGTLTNESQLIFRYIYIMAKFKEINACPPPEAT